MEEFTAAGATVNASLFTFPGSEGFFASNEIAVSGTHLFVANQSNGTIGEYNTSGSTVNAALVSGLGGGFGFFNGPVGVGVSGSDVFVLLLGGGVGAYPGTVAEYTTSGSTVNASLITGVDSLGGFTVSGGDIFVSTANGISEYTTAGVLVHSSVVPGVSGTGFALSGSDLFVLNPGDPGTIGEYTTSGSTVNASLITGLTDPTNIAVSGSDLFVGYGAGMVGEYTTSGSVVNASLYSTGPYLWSDGLAASGSDVFDSVAVIPEPSAFVMLTIGIAALAARGLRRRRAAA